MRVVRLTYVCVGADGWKKQRNMSNLPDPQNWQEHVLPTLLASLAGAGYGAYRAPGGSRVRGGIIGGLGGAGAGAAFSGANAFLDSPLARHMQDSPTLAASMVLGGTGLGLAGGLRAGRQLSENLGLGSQRDRVDNDLEEIDLLGRGSRAFPQQLRSYFKAASTESLGAKAARLAVNNDRQTGRALG